MLILVHTSACNSRFLTWQRDLQCRKKHFCSKEQKKIFLVTFHHNVNRVCVLHDTSKCECLKKSVSLKQLENFCFTCSVMSCNGSLSAIIWSSCVNNFFRVATWAGFVVDSSSFWFVIASQDGYSIQHFPPDPPL